MNRGLSRLSKLLAVASAPETPLKTAGFRSDGDSEGGRDTGAAAIMFARVREGTCVQAEVVKVLGSDRMSAEVQASFMVSNGKKARAGCHTLKRIGD